MSLQTERERKDPSLSHCLLVTALPWWAGVEITDFHPALWLWHWLTVFLLGFFFGVKSHTNIMQLNLT